MLFSQVGINTTTPNASLEIKSSNQATPSNTDGILIPKIDTFPAINPTALQQGMLIYLTTTVGINQPGFYYWNNSSTSWVALIGNEDADWYKTGTSSAPTSINDSMFHSGNVGIGETIPTYKLDVKETNTAKTEVANFIHAAPANGASVNIINTEVNSGSNTNGVLIGLNNFISSSNSTQGVGVFNLLHGHTTDAMHGIRNYFSNTGSGPRMGLYNTFASGTGIRYGLYNAFAGTGNQQTGVYNSFEGTPSFSMIGNHNKFNDVSTQSKTGSYNQFINDPTTNGINYGFRNNFDGIGSNDKYSLYAEILGNGNGNFYGAFNYVSNNGNGNHIGMRNYMNGTGTGTKYGVLNIIENTAGGTHYGVYSSVLKATGYAGYFLGRVSIGYNDSDKYIFPNSRGTLGQIMQTDGSGNLTWQNPSTVIGNNYWSTTGNSTLPTGGFLGTTFDFPLTFKVNNVVSGLIESDMYNKNTFLGYDAGTSSTNIAYNTAIGFEALNSLTGDSFGAGNFNTAIGKGSMYSSTLGNWNTALGHHALYGNLSGNDNCAIGNEALANNISGSNNVAIGSNAGSSELGSNKLYIGSQPLIYGEFDNKLLRVNGKLFVNNGTGTQMLLKNSDKYVHSVDNNIDFGTAGGDFMVATSETNAETAGIRGDGDNVSIWSPGDGSRLVRFLDEDAWNDNNGNPYDNASEKAYIDQNGQYFQVSDAYKKDNIKKISDATQKVTQINGYTYKFKSSPEEIKKGQVQVETAGVLAQELESILPQAVSKNESGEYHVNYAAITPLLIEALKEQNEKIKSLENRLIEIEQLLKK